MQLCGFTAREATWKSATTSSLATFDDVIDKYRVKSLEQPPFSFPSHPFELMSMVSCT
jgi:hypothetical protein